MFIYQILLSDISAHLSEYATLRAIGYDSWYLRRVVFYQCILLTLISCPLAMAVSTVLIKAWRDFTKIPLELATVNILGVIVLGLMVSSLSACLATKELASVDPIVNL